MCVCMYVCMYVCIYIYICNICMRVHVHIHGERESEKYKTMYSMYIYVWMCIYIYIYTVYNSCLDICNLRSPPFLERLQNLSSQATSSRAERVGTIIHPSGALLKSGIPKMLALDWKVGTPISGNLHTYINIAIHVQV